MTEMRWWRRCSPHFSLLAPLGHHVEQQHSDQTTINGPTVDAELCMRCRYLRDISPLGSTIPSISRPSASITKGHDAESCAADGQASGTMVVQCDQISNWSSEEREARQWKTVSKSRRQHTCRPVPCTPTSLLRYEHVSPWRISRASRWRQQGSHRRRSLGGNLLQVTTRLW